MDTDPCARCAELSGPRLAGWPPEQSSRFRVRRPCEPFALLLAVPNQLDRPGQRSEEHTSELQSQSNLVCRLLLEKKKNNPTLISLSLLSPIRVFSQGMPIITDLIFHAFCNYMSFTFYTFYV